jgi:hypothetical protein
MKNAVSIPLVAIGLMAAFLFAARVPVNAQDPSGTVLVCLQDENDPSKSVEVVTFSGSSAVEFVLTNGGPHTFTSFRTKVTTTNSLITVTDNEKGFGINLSVNIADSSGSASIADGPISYLVIDPNTQSHSCSGPGAQPPGVLTLSISPSSETVSAPAEIQLSAFPSIQGAQLFWLDNGSLFSTDQNPALVIFGPGVHTVTCEASAGGQVVTQTITITAQ